MTFFEDREDDYNEEIMHLFTIMSVMFAYC